jgi:leucyl-tRNA synthetase
VHKEYNHREIEKKWQKIWEEEKYYKAEDKSNKPKYYALIEFPYPSGDGLHVGHPRPYIGMDVIARKRRLEGFNVLYPIGWDAFGLPTENYAIKTGKDPREVTKENTDTFRRQIKSLGISFDWPREINTTDPKYYKWTQWIFLQFFKHGLAYKAKTVVNWCPKDKIVLANEEVINGRCERCGTPVEKREKEQWLLAITKYADRLDKDLDTVDYLPQIKTQQRNWIGKSEGAEISFLLNFTYKPEANKNRGPHGERAALKVFTTRPDTIFGATYLVLSPEHLWVTLATDDKHDVLENKEEVKKYVQAAKSRTDIERAAAGKDKTGVELKGVKAINPATNKEIAMFVADYVLPHYGTGAIMAVPAHDERDYQFAKKYNLPIRQVVAPYFLLGGSWKYRDNIETIERRTVTVILENNEGKVLIIREPETVTLIGGGIESGETPEDAALREIKEETGYTSVELGNRILDNYYSKGFRKTKQKNTFTNDYIFWAGLKDDSKIDSEADTERHRLVWTEKDNVAKEIPKEHHHNDIWKLAQNPVYTGEGILVNSGKFDGTTSEEARKAITKFVEGEWKTTYKLRDWIFSRQRYWGEPIPIIHCEKCGYVPVPDEDLPVELPPLRNYQPTDTGKSPLAAVSSWVNVKCPKCDGEAKRETDVMPNWAGSSWYFLRYTDPENDKALADKKKLKHWMPVDWYNGGMEHTTLHLLYSRFWNKFLFDIKVASTSEPFTKRTAHGIILAPDGEKMSKSRGNVINPDDIVETYGADTLRLYEMFLGPFDQAVLWSAESIIGPRRFIEKIWRFQEKLSDQKNSASIQSLVHQTILKVSSDIEAMRFNTAISALMILANAWEKESSINQDDFKKFLLLLQPFCPHLVAEIWQKMTTESLETAKWPEADPKFIVVDKVKIIVQINGKVRGSLIVSPKTDQNEALKVAKTDLSIKKWIDGKEIKKVVFVPDRLLSLVI